jgi:RNA polymerase sigma factor (sigma-70 family)
MQPLDDIALLREYADRHSEEAFSVLVARHINKVYSVALRHAGNPHQAEEITQAVFVILARKAPGLRQGTVLSGWLYHTARLAALTFIRSEIRRARREQEACMQSVSSQTESDAWTRLSPLLDTAMGKLSDKDRDAIVLRFFDGKSMKEVGAALAASEDAAKKRVNRAVEKLRWFFTKRGIVLPATVLTAAISAHSVQAAPVYLTASVATMAAAKGAAVSTSTLTLIKGALNLMAWTKAKTAVIAVAAVVLATGTTTVVVKKNIHPSVGKFTPDDLDAKIAKLNHPGATVKEVLQVLGEPAKYVWNNKTFDKNHLPEKFVMVYPQSVAVMASGGQVVELRSEGRSGGFSWRGKLRLGSSLDEVLQVLGPPSSTVVGKPLDFLDGVLYKDIEGRKGYGYYCRFDQNLRLFFADNKVAALYIIVQGDTLGASTPGEPIPDIDAKIAQLAHADATVDEAIRVLGEPEKYVWGNKTFQKDKLPEIYILAYPGNVNVVVNQGRVGELRSDMPGPGFTYRGKLRLGSSLDEVLQVLGPPSKTVVGKPLAFESGVLYKDYTEVEGEGHKGNSYYARPEQNVRLFFRNDQVTGLYITLWGVKR